MCPQESGRGRGCGTRLRKNLVSKAHAINGLRILSLCSQKKMQDLATFG